MKQVINITLNSIVFAIEQDAYQELDTYISQIKARLASSADQTEIMADVEAAMAEKFIALGCSEKIGVGLHDVAQVRTEMGAPAAFGDEAEEVDETPNVAVSTNPKRLFRDTDNSVIAGVASGIAKYFSIDPVIVRIAFVASIFINGIGIIAYVILWLVVPAAQTTADKFAMSGKRVTVEDIAARVKKNLQEHDLHDVTYVRSVWQSVRRFLQQLFTHLGGFLHLLVTVLRYVCGIAFVIGGALGAAVLVSIYSIILLSEKTFLPVDAQTAVEIMFSTPLGIIAIAASFVLNLIPFLVVIVLGASLLKKQNLFTANKTITLAVVWIVALVLAGTASAIQVEKVWHAIDQDEFAQDMHVIIDDTTVSIRASEIPVSPITPVSAESVVCTDDMKQAQACAEIYAPVCGLVDVQCVTAPCSSIPETFSNGCSACAQGNVESYTPGMCGA